MLAATLGGSTLPLEIIQVRKDTPDDPRTFWIPDANDSKGAQATLWDKILIIQWVTISHYPGIPFLAFLLEGEDVNAP